MDWYRRALPIVLAQRLPVTPLPLSMAFPDHFGIGIRAWATVHGNLHTGSWSFRKCTHCLHSHDMGQGNLETISGEKQPYPVPRRTQIFGDSLNKYSQQIYSLNTPPYTWYSNKQNIQRNYTLHFALPNYVSLNAGTEMGFLFFICNIGSCGIIRDCVGKRSPYTVVSSVKQSQNEHKN